MSRFWHFLQYHNSVPIALGVMALGAGGAYAATNPEAIYSESETVLTVDNTYIADKDLENYTPRIEIVGVMEDEIKYYVAYKFHTIDVQDYVWRDVIKEERLQVDKKFLGTTRDLGVYATEQLKQLVDNELARLAEVQTKERARVSRKTVATAYGGLIGKFLDETTEILPGYTPVVTPPEPDLSQNSPVVAQDPREKPVSFTRAELEQLIKDQITDALARHDGKVAGAATSTEPAPGETPPAEQPMPEEQTPPSQEIVPEPESGSATSTTPAPKESPPAEEPAEPAAQPAPGQGATETTAEPTPSPEPPPSPAPSPEPTLGSTPAPEPPPTENPAP